MPTLKRHWTAADLEDLPDDGNRYEVIDGELLVTPAPAFRHQRAVAQLYLLLHGYVAGQGFGEVYFAPADITFTMHRAVQPDVFVLPRVAAGGHAERFADVGRLLLAVEVLSPGTARADRVMKRMVYREQGVPDYWIVDLDSRTVECSTPSDPRVTVMAESIEWRPEGAQPALVIDLVSYFARVLDG